MELANACPSILQLRTSDRAGKGIISAYKGVVRGCVNTVAGWTPTGRPVCT